ncbi:MAG: hypothetical protein HC933_13715 [Pleurocapsa sp. SU_196_0]|nr:hypothetical protein [Pleurocapsa sp. SU_196_0]
MRTQAIRFDNGPKLYPFKTDTAYVVDTRVVVNSRRGLELATIREGIKDSHDHAAARYCASPRHRTWNAPRSSRWKRTT